MKNIIAKIFDLPLGWAITVIVAILGLLFGFLCLEAWLAMLLWNFAVVSAIAVCVPIGFWEAMCLMLAFNLLIPKSINKREG